MTSVLLVCFEKIMREHCLCTLEEVQLKGIMDIFPACSRFKTPFKVKSHFMKGCSSLKSGAKGVNFFFSLSLVKSVHFQYTYTFWHWSQLVIPPKEIVSEQELHIAWQFAVHPYLLLKVCSAC